MKRAFGLIFIGLFHAFSISALNPGWPVHFGSAGAQTAGKSVIADLRGNVFVMGTFKGTVDFDPGPGVFSLSSSTLSSTFLTKLDSSGNFLWAEKFDLDGRSIVADKYGNIVMLGNFLLLHQYSVDVNPGPDTFFVGPPEGYSWQSGCVIKLNNNGSFKWAKPFFGSHIIPGYAGSSISLDSNQNISVAGFFMSYADFNPGFGNAKLNGNSVRMQSRGLAPAPTVFVLSLDSSGSKTF